MNSNVTLICKERTLQRFSSPTNYDQRKTTIWAVPSFEPFDIQILWSNLYMKTVIIYVQIMSPHSSINKRNNRTLRTSKFKFGWIFCDSIVQYLHTVRYLLDQFWLFALLTTSMNVQIIFCFQCLFRRNNIPQNLWWASKVPNLCLANINLLRRHLLHFL